ncbi:MAG: PQ-loop domain-containing transporter [Chlamydiota bacterium]
MALAILSWIAIVILSVSYWFQIWKIHVHKEVRDISLTYNVLLAIGFGILAFTALQEKSLIFLVKQVMTTIPVTIIIFQVLYHKNDRWHDVRLKRCKNCSQEVEKYWKFCAYCGEEEGKKRSDNADS